MYFVKTSFGEVVKEITCLGCVPKNPKKVLELLAEGWSVDPEQMVNIGQINDYSDEVSYYDAENDKFTTI